MFSLTSGVIRLYSVLADGRRQVVAFHYPGEFISFSPQRDYHCTGEAVTRASVCRFDVARFESFASGRDGLIRLQRNRLSADLAVSQIRILMLGRSTARERLAWFLLDIWQRAEAGQRKPRPLLDLPMTRSDIADYLGLTKETVSRQLSALRRAGMISRESGQKLAIHDLDGLYTLAPVVMPNHRIA